MAQDPDSRFLVVDVGGTNTRIACTQGAMVDKQTIARFRNAEYGGLEAVLAQYLRGQDASRIMACCVAIAGPVQNRAGRLTNRNWQMTEDSIAAATGIRPAVLVNDLQAQGYALPHLGAGDVLCLREGRPSGQANALLAVNLGTGFNASPVFFTPSGAYVATSESGHANMPIRDARDMRLCAHVEAQHGFAAVDDILTGRGLEQVFAFVAEEAGMARKMQSGAIIEAAAKNSDPLAVEAVNYFVRLTALVMANLALVQLPFGGIYMVGGLSSAIAPFFEQAGFEAAFTDKGRFSGFMDQFGIYVVQDDYAALTGMAAYLDQSFGSGNK